MYIWQNNQFHSIGIDIYTDARSGNNIDIYLNKQKFLYFDTNGVIYQTIGNDFNGYKVTYGNVTNDSIEVYGIPYVNGQAMTNISIATFTYTGETMKQISKIKLGDETYKISDTTALSELANKVDINSKVIDGQWVSKKKLISTSVATTITQHSLADYLPNDGYSYEVLASIFLYKTGDHYVSIGSDLIINNTVEAQTYNATISVSNYGRTSSNTFTIPVGSGRYLTSISSSAKSTDYQLGVLGYRRIGTNE